VVGAHDADLTAIAREIHLHQQFVHRHMTGFELSPVHTAREFYYSPFLGPFVR
jgi:hypothetical protein